MTDSLRAFLSGLIDYAGLFPPARLSMPAAVKTYARHLTSDHAWMVGRFICPLSRLVDFAEESHVVLRGHEPVRIAGLASPIGESAVMLEAAASDASLITQFEERGTGLVDVLEVRLPDDLLEKDATGLRSALDRFEETLRGSGARFDRIFYEIGRTAAWEGNIQRCVSALAGVPHRGFKIRCGGITPDAYPTPKQVASAIRVCGQAGVPFKATAGLHHPVRQLRPAEGVVQHGFLNVFTAGLLVGNGMHDDQLLLDVVDDRSLEAFTFTDEALVWNDRAVSLAEIQAGREVSATTYGSCNIDESLVDLREAGLL